MRERRTIKKLYLIIRGMFFRALSGFTFPLRKKALPKESLKNIFVITMKRAGDAVISIPAFRAIKESLPQSHLTAFANSYIQDILERIDAIDHLVIYEKGSPFLQKARAARRLRRKPFDLAVDLTCDYTFEGALWAYLSGARYRVGYNTNQRGFLFNRPVKHDKKILHAVDEVLNIIKSIHLETQDKSLRISASKEAEAAIRQILRERGVKEGDLLIGIHPGGYYPTQRWLNERYAEIGDRVVEKYRARLALIGGPAEEDLIHQIEKNMRNRPMIFLNLQVRNLLALIQSCRLLVCNNSGPLHMAVALGTKTVSMIGPTIPERWWPYEEGHVVIRKNLPCMPCNEGSCRLKTHDCLRLITVEEVFEAVELQISKIAIKKG